jgi:predicted PurR-regulated permease PerM
MVVASALVILIILKAGSAIAGPILLFVFLAILVVPVFNYLRHRGLSSGLSLVIMLIGIVAAVVGLNVIVVGSFAKLGGKLAEYNTDFGLNTEELVAKLDAINLPPEAADAVRQQLFGILGRVSASLVSNTVTMIAGSLMALIALSFIMVESDSFGRRLHRGLGDDSNLLHRMELFQHSLFGYIIARVKLNFLTALGVFVMLVILGVDFALLWGVLAFLLSFVPYIGLAIAAIPPILLGTAESGLTVGIILAIGYLIINQVIEQIIEPKVIGKEMTLSPTLTLFSVIFWTWVLGPLGAMLAGPLAALMILVLGAFDETRWIAIFFSSEDSPLVTGMEPPEDASSEGAPVPGD